MHTCGARAENMVVNFGCHSISGSSAGGPVLRTAKNAFLEVGWVWVEARGIGEICLEVSNTTEKHQWSAATHKFQAQENDVETATPQGKQPILVPYNSLKTCYV